MAEQSKLILYEQPLELPDLSVRKEGTLLEQVLDIVGRLLATGKIDIQSNIKAKFIGDKRIIQDIKLLAESGYGEDKLGNNINLPEKLAYLRR